MNTAAKFKKLVGQSLVVLVYTLAVLAGTLFALDANARTKELATRLAVDDTGATALALNEGMLVAQADPVPAAPPAATAVVGMPDAGVLAAPVNEAKDLLDVIQNKKGAPGFVWLLVAAALRLLVQAVRWGARKIPGTFGEKMTTFVDNPLTAYLMPAVLSLVSAMATSVASGGPWFSLDILNTAIQVAMGAVGIYVGEKKFKEAVAKGKEAAADPGPTLNA